MSLPTDNKTGRLLRSVAGLRQACRTTGIGYFPILLHSVKAAFGMNNFVNLSSHYEPCRVKVTLSPRIESNHIMYKLAQLVLASDAITDKHVRESRP